MILQEEGDILSGCKERVPRESNNVILILGDTKRRLGYTVRSGGGVAKGK